MALFDLAPKETAGELFGREREERELRRLVEAHRWVVVLGPRMVGKTSLVKAVRHRLRWPGAYVNLWGVRSVSGMVEGLLSGLNESASLRSRLARAAQRVEGFSFGPGGISMSGSRRPLKSAWDLLNILGTEPGDCLVVLDEVQELSANAGALLRLLGNLFNSRPKLGFIFTGSRVGLARTLLEPTTSSPLFGRAPVPFPVGPFDRATSERFLERGAKESGVPLTPPEIARALEGPLDGTPGWLTLFGNHVAVRRLPPEVALKETVREGKKVAESELAHFFAAHDVPLYWAALKATALGASWVTIREAMDRATGGPVNDGAVRRVLQALEAAALLRRSEAGYAIVDPMVRAYVAEATRPPAPARGPHPEPVEARRPSSRRAPR